ncbi:MAG: hypothetical protein JST49_12595 [Bacteroidetes bacterium]|nr:hypothetical protein [Bacteroidota bacterium]
MQLLLRKTNKARLALQQVLPFCASYIALGIISAFMYYHRKPEKVKV